MGNGTVSAIIPTKNRADDLRITLRTLLEQTVLPREVIIVDQSADKKSAIVAREEFDIASSKLSVIPKLKYIYDPSITGVSAARNRAMQCANEAIWLFLDDDVIMEPDFVEELLRVYSANEKIDGVSGVITNYPIPHLVYRAWMQVFARGPFLEKRRPIYWRADKFRNAGLVPVAGFSGGLMSLRAEVSRKGSFDTRIHDGEDVDFCLNLKRDAKLVIAPKARLKHMSSPVGRSQDLWLQRFAVSQSFLYEKNWRYSLRNRICFAWLCVGITLAALSSGMRRLSWKPLHAAIIGVRMGRKTARS